MKEYQYIPVGESEELNLPEKEMLEEEILNEEFVEEEIEFDLEHFARKIIANVAQEILGEFKILLQQERECVGGKRPAGFKIGAGVQCKGSVEDEIARIFGNAAQ